MIQSDEKIRMQLCDLKIGAAVLGGEHVKYGRSVIME
jgi:hypothetical protein